MHVSFCTWHQCPTNIGLARWAAKECYLISSAFEVDHCARSPRSRPSRVLRTKFIVPRSITGIAQRYTFRRNRFSSPKIVVSCQSGAVYSRSWRGAGGQEFIKPHYGRMLCLSWSFTALYVYFFGGSQPQLYVPYLLKAASMYASFGRLNCSA